MQITRSGSARYQGSKRCEFSPRIVWDEQRQSIRLSANYVPDFNTPAHHDYDIYLDGAELSRILQEMASSAIRGKAGEVIKHSAAHVGALVGLANACMNTQVGMLDSSGPRSGE